MVFGDLISSLAGSYNELVNILPQNFKIIPPLFFIAMTIALYSIFIWFFYRFLARKDVLRLNLEKYNVYKHSGILKFFRTMLYVIQYMIIAPIAIFLWFAVLSIFVIILAKEIEVGTVILICAALISAIRITAYYKENLSLELAKLFPLTLLAVAITQGILSFEKVISQLAVIPSFLDSSGIYLLFILSIEFLLRIIDTVFSTGEIADKEEN